MSFKLSVATVSVVVLLALAGCVGAGPADIGTSIDTSTTSHTISVSGVGSAEADPDLALVRVAVVSEAETAEAARDATASAVQSMRDAFRDNGVPDESVRTSYYNLQPVYDFSDERRELVGYQASHGFEIETAPDRSGEIIDLAVDNGATRIDGVQFTLTEETRAELRDVAIRDAMANARADADTIAEAAGVTVAGLHSASTGGVSFIPFEARGGDAAESPTVIEPGPVTVSANVQVTYTIED